jgi:beta/gamma crystallin
MRKALIALAATAALPLSAVPAQVTSPGPTAYPGTLTLYELPGYFGRSVTVTSATPDLATRSFAKRAQSARVVGEWQVCPQAAYQGSCQVLNRNTPLLSRSAIASARPAADAVAATTTGTSTSTSTTTSTSSSSATAAATVDLDALDADAGVEGQDVAFFARPSLGGSQVSAGANDRAAADAFCARAGFAASAYSARARVQASNLIDLTARTRVRAYPLRDVLCRR